VSPNCLVTYSSSRPRLAQDVQVQEGCCVHQDQAAQPPPLPGGVCQGVQGAQVVAHQHAGSHG
ncbi:hypothetical protein, partial [Klebsiella aerogenes]|uniref:hypothetical protein n=1 Tax=Klebsiella aerogenes TaxID=548 RepID=UPI001952D93A